MAFRRSLELQGTQEAVEAGGRIGNQQVSAFHASAKQIAITASFTTGATAPQIVVGSNDVALLMLLPSRYKVLGGRISFGAMGAGATASLGIYRRIPPGVSEGGQGSGAIIVDGAATRYANAIAVNAAGEADVAHTAALGFLTTEDLTMAGVHAYWLGVSAGATAWANGQPFRCLFTVAVI